MFTLDTDRRPLLDYADDLERQAETLDPQIAPATGPGFVEQRQAEQQPQQAKEAAGDTPPRKPG